MELYHLYAAVIFLAHNGVGQTTGGICLAYARSTLQDYVFLVFDQLFELE